MTVTSGPDCSKLTMSLVNVSLKFQMLLSNIQSNLDYSKCQGPPDFLRIINSSNFRNRYFSEMFGSFRSVLIFDCISIKNGEQVSYLTFENKEKKQSDMNLLVFFVLFTSRAKK